MSGYIMDEISHGMRKPVFCICQKPKARYHKQPQRLIRVFDFSLSSSLRKHAHAMYCDFYGRENDNFQMKKCDIFQFFAQSGS